MASRLTSAAQGATTGASLGSVVGPVGTVVGTGVGALAGALAGGKTEAQLLEEKRLAELMRRQELGALGYTDQEMAVALGQAQGALGQQQQAQAAQQRAALATQDLGAGAVFRAQQEEASQQRREMEGARQKVLERDIAEKRAQEAELQTLAGLAEARQQQEREAMMSALVDTSGQLIEAGQEMFQIEEVKRKKIAMEKKKNAEAKAALKRGRGGQEREAVRSTMSIHDNIAPTPVAAPAAPAASAALDRFDVLAFQEEALKTGVPVDLIRRAHELNMSTEEYLVLLRSMGKDV